MSEQQQWRQKSDGTWEPIPPDPNAPSWPDMGFSPLDMPEEIIDFKGLDLRNRSVTNTTIAINMGQRFSQNRTHAARIATLRKFLLDAWVNANTEFSPNKTLNDEISRFIGANWREIGVNLETHSWDHQDNRAATSEMMKGFRATQPFWKRVLRISWITFTCVGCPLLAVAMFTSMLTSALPLYGVLFIGPVITIAASLIIGTTIAVFQSGPRSSGGRSSFKLNFNFVRFIQGAVMLAAAAICLAQWGPVGLFGLFMLWGADVIVVGLILTILRLVGLTNTRHFGTLFTATVFAIFGFFVGMKDATPLACALAVVGLIAGGTVGSIAGEVAYKVLNKDGGLNTRPHGRGRR